MRTLTEQADIYGALSSMEGKLKQFISLADDPLDAMDAMVAASSKLGAQYASGVPVRPGELSQMDSLAKRVNDTFARVYGAYAGTREAGYALAKLIGADTKTSGGSRPSSDVQGHSNTDLLKAIADMSKNFQPAFRNVQETGAKLLGMVRSALDAIDSKKTDGAAEAQAIIPAFLAFRDSTSSGYYSILGGVAKRVNQIRQRFTREKPVMQKTGAPEAPAAPMTEDMIEIPWEGEIDEDGDFDIAADVVPDVMAEAKKDKDKKKKDDEIPVGAAGNLPEPSSAPPIGVEKKAAMPPMMQVERLVRSLKAQIIEGLK